jgi:hypothetical protein
MLTELCTVDRKLKPLLSSVPATTGMRNEVSHTDKVLTLGVETERTSTHVASFAYNEQRVTQDKFPARNYRLARNCLISSTSFRVIKTTLDIQRESILKGSDDGVLRLKERRFWTLFIVQCFLKNTTFRKQDLFPSSGKKKRWSLL